MRSIDVILKTLCVITTSFGVWGLWVWHKLRLERRQTRQTDGLLESLTGWWLIWHPSKGMLACNKRFHHILHPDPKKEPAFYNFLEIFEPDAREALQVDLNQLIQTKEPFQKVYKIPTQQDFFEIRGTLFQQNKALLWIQKAPPEYVLKEAHVKHNPQPVQERLEEETVKNPSLIKLLEVIFHQMPIIIWCQNARTQKLVFCNQSYADAFDMTMEEVLEKNLQLIPFEASSADATPMHFHKHAIIRGERRLLDVYRVKADRYEIAYAFDVSDIEHYQTEIQRHLQSHQEVLELISVPISIYGPDKRLQFFNAAYTRLCGIDAYWLDQKPTLSEVLEELRVRRRLPEYADFPAFKKKQDQYFTAMPGPIEEVQHLPDDRTIRVVAYPHPLGGLMFMFEDVSDKLSLERQYNTLIDVQRETLDHLYEGVIVFGSNNRLRLTNPAFGRLWGVNPKQLMPGEHISSVVEAIKPYCHYGSDWEVFKMNIIMNATDRIPKSGRLERTDGSILSFSYVPLPDGGHLLSYFDVTDSSKVEHALRDRNEALEKADQMKSEFIANISYELREPLNTIIGFTELLNKQYLGGLNDQQMEYSKAVLSSSQQLLSLINDLLDLASIEGGYFYLKRHFFDLYQMASSVMHHVQDKAEEKSLKLILDCSSHIGLFWADETRIKQIILNLLKNSINYSTAGGEIRLILKKDDEFLWLRVVDTGIGIPEPDLERIFEKFERIALPNEQTHGAGLGLSLVKHFTEMHGGTVHIQSKEGSGTTVECRFPLQAEEIQDDSSEQISSEHEKAPLRLVSSSR